MVCISPEVANKKIVTKWKICRLNRNKNLHHLIVLSKLGIHLNYSRPFIKAALRNYVAQAPVAQSALKIGESSKYCSKTIVLELVLFQKKCIVFKEYLRSPYLNIAWCLQGTQINSGTAYKYDWDRQR